jgi:exodeoxyribonuclease V beta subunit
MSIPLTGTNLIEASAGTGKTYNIAGLYLRLLLEKRLNVDQILVVTFTKSATQELQERIRNKLIAARKAFLTGTCNDTAVLKLINRMGSDPVANNRVQEALQEFDNAAIFTIHGLCQRLLIDHAFEMGGRFDTELMTEPSALMTAVANDFWRRNFYQAPSEIISYVLKKSRSPMFFQELIDRIWRPGVCVIPELDKPQLNHLAEFQNCWSQIQSMWPHVRFEIENLLEDPGLNATIYGSFKPDKASPDQTVRQNRISELLKQMDRFVSESEPDLPLWSKFDNFTSRKINSATKKGHDPISHPFFDHCQALRQTAESLVNELAAHWIYVKYKSLRFSEKKLDETKSQLNIQFFDDLLATVRQALTEPQGNLLAAKIRGRYRAALVDEFQDTDQIQYEIFSRIFSDGTCPLFMIGDPKQAIYSFRGADVFSYFEAASQAVNRYTLTENFRSSPALIQAVNALFGNVNRPLIFKAIPFVEGTAGTPGDPKGDYGKIGLHIWHLTLLNDQKITVKEINTNIIRAVCTEIIRLVEDKPNKLQLGEIAILVRTNRQAGFVKSALSDADIPAVIYSAGNVFNTAEADEIGRILLSISKSSQIGLLKAALTTDVMGWRIEDIDQLEMKADWLEKRIARFKHYQRSWKQDGFIAMFRRLLAKENIRARLLALPNGDRRLTNLLHLGEMLHAAAIEKNLGMTGLLKWFFKHVDPEMPQPEIHQLRLESDDQAVKVITIHKSKGLEFPVVFCPFSWGSTQVVTEDFIFHDAQADGRITLDLGSADKEKHWIQARNEHLAENVRLLYVAVTRAAHRCYLAWPKTRTAGSSALAYLIHGRRVASDFRYSDDIAAKLYDHFSNLTPDAYLADLHQLERRSQGSIVVSPLPEKRITKQVLKTIDPAHFQVRRFSRKLDKSWGITSYSALVSHTKPDHELPDRDEVVGSTEIVGDASIIAEPHLGPVDDSPALFLFPTGVNSGIFFHDILENLDFSSPDKGNWHDLIRTKISAYGFDKVWEIPIVSMLDNLSNLVLSTRNAPFTLSEVENSARINEMSFYFPLRHINSGILANIFREFSDHVVLENFPQTMERLTFSPVTGLMMGFLDLLFEHKGRYYIVDWKSNFLGGTAENYIKKRLNEEMRKSFYILQYHLYVLASHLHLKMRIPGYDYDKYFGGVFYIFLRGINAEKGSDYGIFEDRPHGALIEALEKALVPE